MKRKILLIFFVIFMAESAFSLSYGCVGGRGPVISSIENVSDSEIHLENEASFNGVKAMQESSANLRMYGQIANSFYQNESNYGIERLEKTEINRSKLTEVFNFSRDLIAPEKIDKGDLLISGPPGFCRRSVKAIFSEEGRLKYAEIGGRFANNVVTEERRVTVSGKGPDSANFKVSGEKFTLNTGQVKNLKSGRPLRLKLQEVKPVNRPGLGGREPVRYNVNYALGKNGEKQGDHRSDEGLIQLAVSYIAGLFD